MVSKAFQGGVSLDRILLACHWKAHNTFTQFYLKHLAWADSELYYLGPVLLRRSTITSKNNFPVYIVYIVYILKKKKKRRNSTILTAGLP